MSSPTKKCVLQLKDGKFVAVRMESTVPKLCAVERQNNGPVVDIWEKENGNAMALRFQHENNYYLPKVNENGDLQLEMAEIPNDTSDGYWFQKKDVGGGDHYYLQSVFNKKHLIKQNVQRKVIFILGDLGEGVEVTDVSITDSC